MKILNYHTVLLVLYFTGLKFMAQAVDCTTLLKVSDIRANGFCSQIEVKNIRGTNLKTGTFYSLSMVAFPGSHVTWSRKSHSTYGNRYVVFDTHASKEYLYEAGGELFFHQQWFFIPAKGYPGWYHMANRGLPGSVAGWNPDVNYGNNLFYFTLDPFYSLNKPRQEYLFKPTREGDHYQLRSKIFPRASIGTASAFEDGSGSKRYHITIDNVKTNEGYYQKGGNSYESTLIDFVEVKTDDKLRLKASISKFQFLDSQSVNQSNEDNMTFSMEQEELAAKSLFRNNGTVTLTEEITGGAQISENVYIERPQNFTNYFSVFVDESVQFEGNPKPTVVKSPNFQQQLVSFYASNNQTSLNYTMAKDFTVKQTLHIPQCTEYAVDAFVNIIKEYPVEYIVHYKLTGEEEGVELSAVELRRKLFNEDWNNLSEEDYQYVDILDEQAVLMQAKGKMWVKFAMDSVIDGTGTGIDSCIGEYVCTRD